MRSLNDIGVACYISGAEAPGDVAKLLDNLAERLRKAFLNFSPDQVQPQTYSVTEGVQVLHGGIELFNFNALMTRNSVDAGIC